MQKLTTLKQQDNTEKWYLIDAADVRLGQLSTKIASLLLGKETVDSVDYMPSNNKIVVINTDNLAYYPAKETSKMYYRHSGFPGGLKQRTLGEQMKLDSRKVLQTAVYGMLPKNKLRDKLIINVKFYKASEHEHEAQKPMALKIK